MKRTALALLLASTTSASAQLEISWFTIYAGGGSSSGGCLTVQGTIGQHDAGASSGGGLTAACGFWAAASAATCYPNCDVSTTPPILNVNDFVCFLNRFASADAYANCDNSTTPPTLNVNDFICFLNRFAAGCS